MARWAAFLKRSILQANEGKKSAKLSFELKDIPEAFQQNNNKLLYQQDPPPRNDAIAACMLTYTTTLKSFTLHELSRSLRQSSWYGSFQDFQVVVPFLFGVNPGHVTASKWASDSKQSSLTL